MDSIILIGVNCAQSAVNGQRIGQRSTPTADPSSPRAQLTTVSPVTRVEP